MTDSLFDSLYPGETTASAIVRRFAANSTIRDNISSEDLKPIYSALNTTKAMARGTFTPLIKNVPVILPNNDPIHAVIVETRKHPCLEFVVCQFADKLEVDIQIFHSSHNRQFITESRIGHLIDTGRVQLTELDVKSFSPREYNALLLNQSFWASLIGRGKILIFQTDSLLCDHSIYSLQDFRHFDYIGSNWNRNRPVGIVIDGGSGGLSLRDWRLTMECLNRFPPDLWPGGEDGYFAFHLDLMGAQVAREDDCGKFSTQSDFVDKSFGAHQIQNLQKLVLSRFLEYCPEAQILLPERTR